MASINHSFSVTAAKVFAWAITKKSDCLNRFNIETGPGDKLFRNFKKRQNLTNRKPDKVDRWRSRMANMTVFKQHFDFLEETMDKLNLRNLSQWYHG